MLPPMVDTALIRSQMPSVTNAVYFNTGTFGPFPLAVKDAMNAHVDGVWNVGRIGDDRYAEQSAIEEAARAAMGRVVNAPSTEIALGHCTSDGLNLVVGGIDWQPGDQVVIGDFEHPGLTVPLQVMGERRGIEVIIVPITYADDPAQVIADALTPRTKLVALSHVIWTTGRIMPIPRMSEIVRDHGAVFLVDAAQGPGCIPVDVQTLGCDFYTISGQKWLCGPSGTGGLWVNPGSLDRIAPAFPGYPTMQKTPDGPRMWNNARRFEPGTVTHTALVGLTTAIEWRESVGGFTATHAAAMQLAAYLRDCLAEVPKAIVSHVDVPSPFVAFEIEGMPAPVVVRKLEDQGIIARFLPGTALTRIAVGCWNDESDVDRLVAALGAL